VPADINLDLDRYMVQHGLHNGLHYRPSWLARHSVLWSKLEMNATILRRQRVAMRSNGRDDIPVGEIVPAFDRRLRTLVSAIRANGSQPVLLLMGGQVRRGQSKSDQVAAAATDLFYMPYITIESLLDIKDEYAGSFGGSARICTCRSSLCAPPFPGTRSISGTQATTPRRVGDGGARDRRGAARSAGGARADRPVRRRQNRR
jgi:hypothetical protein